MEKHPGNLGCFSCFYSGTTGEGVQTMRIHHPSRRIATKTYLKINPSIMESPDTDPLIPIFDERVDEKFNDPALADLDFGGDTHPR